MADEVKELIEQTLTQTIAALTLQRVSERDIAEQLKLSRHAVRKVMKSEDFKTELKAIADQAANIALQRFKRQIDELEPLAFMALKHNLEEKKIDAVRVWAEFAGVKAPQQESAQAGSLTIVMPGATTEQVIDVTPKGNPDDQV